MSDTAFITQSVINWQTPIINSYARFNLFGMEERIAGNSQVKLELWKHSYVFSEKEVTEKHTLHSLL